MEIAAGSGGAGSHWRRGLRKRKQQSRQRQQKEDRERPHLGGFWMSNQWRQRRRRKNSWKSRWKHRGHQQVDSGGRCHEASHTVGVLCR